MYTGGENRKYKKDVALGYVSLLKVGNYVMVVPRGSSELRWISTGASQNG
jgi:hypothetical protein